jgi:hypothetical protein
MITQVDLQKMLEERMRRKPKKWLVALIRWVLIEKWLNKHLAKIGDKEGVDFMQGVVDVLDINTLTLVAELDVSKVSKEYNATFLLPGSEDIIFLYKFYAELDPIFYAYKSAIGTPDFQWYEVEKVN